MKEQFIATLHANSLPELQGVPKSDLHNHAGRGGNLKYIEAWANTKIAPPDKPFDSLSHMQQWFQNNVKCHCPGVPGYLKRIEASFVQARHDNIAVLALNFGLDEVDALGGVASFTAIMDELHRQYAPEAAFFPELSFGRECPIEPALLSRLDEVLSYRWFKSIDICNDELAQPIRNFKPIYRQAKAAGLILKAHVGEFGSADDVMEAVYELELHEVHHGIAAASSARIMNWLADHRIRLNICPTSNVMLKVADSYAAHPIRKLYDHGVPVTINTDDLLIFNQSVSQEYLNLYQAGTMTAEELNAVRESGLKYIGS
ncbi:hypothetical protein V3851_12295 [Paenibacillus sp. M1]|uniref:Adenosine deaminase domain-containing protein n=1 Tax=Paenibacillus haidiansis TaxID=1574488 RepID=A0ABU7VSB2_9BACL